MSRETRARSLRVLAVFGVAMVTVWLAIQQWPGDGSSQASTDRVPGARTLSRADSGEWLRQLPGGRPGVATVEIRVDRLLEEISPDGTIIISSEEVAQLVRGILAADGDAARPIESIRVGELLDEIRRVKVSYGSLSVTLERRELLAMARQALGSELDLESMQVSELLARYPVLEMSTGAVSAELQGRSIGGVMREVLGKVDRVSLTRDADFAERNRLQLSYAEVTSLVRDVRIDGFDPRDERGVYDEAFSRLLSSDRLDHAPLLDGHQRYEQELAAADLSALDRSAQIAFRWEARRRAFGEQMAERLFSRQEAMERYEVDRIAIESDPGLSAEQRAARIQQRRGELKVELASRGTYMGFPDEARAEITAELRERYGERLDAMTDEERRAVERAAYLDRLPVEIRAKIEGGRP